MTKRKIAMLNIILSFLKKIPMSYAFIVLLGASVFFQQIYFKHKINSLKDEITVISENLKKSEASNAIYEQNAKIAKEKEDKLTADLEELTKKQAEKQKNLSKTITKIDKTSIKSCDDANKFIIETNKDLSKLWGNQ